jgi:hypothetical protein
MDSRENRRAHCPDDRPTSMHVHTLAPRRVVTLGGPVVPIGLGALLLVGAYWMFEAFSAIAGVLLGMPTGCWLLRELWGELTLAWECHQPLRAYAPTPDDEERATLPLELPPARPAIEPPGPRVALPLVIDADVLEVKR